MAWTRRFPCAAHEKTKKPRRERRRGQENLKCQLPTHAIKARGRTSGAEGSGRVFDLGARSFRHTVIPLGKPHLLHVAQDGEGVRNLKGRRGARMASARATIRFALWRWITFHRRFRTTFSSHGTATLQFALHLLEVADHDAKHHGSKQPFRQIEGGCEHRNRGFSVYVSLSSRRSFRAEHEVNGGRLTNLNLRVESAMHAASTAHR